MWVVVGREPRDWAGHGGNGTEGPMGQQGGTEQGKG